MAYAQPSPADRAAIEWRLKAKKAKAKADYYQLRLAMKTDTASNALDRARVCEARGPLLIRVHGTAPLWKDIALWTLSAALGVVAGLRF